MKPFFLVLLLLALGRLSFAQGPTRADCAALRQGTYRYVGMEDTSAYFVIDKSSHIEYHQGGKYLITSRLEWKGDCANTLTMLSNTIPDFPFKPGDLMRVTITRVAGNDFFYHAQVGDQGWDGEMIKVK